MTTTCIECGEVVDGKNQADRVTISHRGNWIILHLDCFKDVAPDEYYATILPPANFKMWTDDIDEFRQELMGEFIDEAEEVVEEYGAFELAETECSVCKGEGWYPSDPCRRKCYKCKGTGKATHE